MGRLTRHGPNQKWMVRQPYRIPCVLAKTFLNGMHPKRQKTGLLNKEAQLRSANGGRPDFVPAIDRLSGVKAMRRRGERGSGKGQRMIPGFGYSEMERQKQYVSYLKRNAPQQGNSHTERVEQGRKENQGPAR